MKGRTGRTHSLRNLSRELQRLNRVLRRITGAQSAHGFSPEGPQVNAALVRGIIAARRLRDDYFEPPIGDAAWVVLLEAFVAHNEGRGAAMTSFGISAGIARSTAHRWVVQLIERGLLVRQGDPGDERVALVALTDEAAARIHAYLVAAFRLSPLVL